MTDYSFVHDMRQARVDFEMQYFQNIIKPQWLNKTVMVVKGKKIEKGVKAKIIALNDHPRYGISVLLENYGWTSLKNVSDPI